MQPQRLIVVHMSASPGTRDAGMGLRGSWLASRVRVLGCLLGLIVGPVFSADGPVLLFDHIPESHGLSQSTVNCIFQDRMGFIWACTQDGLNRYDGYEFVVYTHDVDDTTSISCSFVWQMMEDRFGTIWVATRDGLNRFDAEQGHFTAMHHDAKDPLSLCHDHVRVVYEDRQGGFWVGTRGGGLDRLDRASGQFTHFALDKGRPEGLGSAYVESLTEDRHGVLWVGTLGGGLHQLQRDTGQFVRFRHDEGDPFSLPHDTVWDVLESGQGRLWVATAAGICQWNRNLLRFEPLDIQDWVLGETMNMDTRCILEDEKGVLWFGTAGDGLFQYDARAGALNRYAYDPHHPRSLGNNIVRALFEDSGSVLWVGTVRGLDRCVRRKSQFSLYADEVLSGEPSPNRAVKTIFEDRKGSIWFGCSGGLWRFDPVAQTAHRVMWDSEANGGHVVGAMAEDAQGRLWLGLVGGGLAQFHPDSGDLIHYTHQPDDPTSLGRGFVTAVHVDGLDRVWVGTNSTGLSVLDQATGRFRHFRYDPEDRKRLIGDNIKVIFGDSRENLWVGTASGLCRLCPDSDRFLRYGVSPSDPACLKGKTVKSMCEDRLGLLWIGTYGGLNRLDPENGTFTHFTMVHGLPNDVILGILEDDQGLLWLSTNHGLSRFDPLRCEFTNFDVTDGLQANEFSGNVACKTHRGILFFGGPEGFNAFVPDRITRNAFVPPVVFTAVHRLFGTARPVEAAMDVGEELVLPHDRATFSVAFAALSFAEPSRNRYAYLLKGLQDDWVSLGSKRELNLSLHPGDYELQVKGSNNHGVWNGNPASLQIRITPPFWKTDGFIVLALMAFGMASYFAIHLSRRYLTLIAFWKKKHHVGHYRILETVATGGMGAVYKARDMLSSEIVAIKVIRDEFNLDADQRRRFVNEAALIDQLDHPHIVRVLERGEQGGDLFIAMEYLEGETLGQRMTRVGSMELQEALSIALQLGHTLARIHRRGIVHRDLKPDNVMLVNREGRDDFVKLLDFGLASAHSVTRLTEFGMIVGTVSYISPEQISGAISASSDWYALGVIMYEMITGEKPFQADTSVEAIQRVLCEAPVPPGKHRSDIPESMNQLIVAMLDKDSGQRPEGKEIVRQLESLREEGRARNQVEGVCWP